ncbi:hypothetical protein PCANC_05072 [Puccinia coronata f. sp. avenae]|uniref:SAM domain-containing protein n=1 Tax=Puccinia coronata f. sp. avenae TaxID=200324 RepID=A0A2N5T746_9BASI|nr:hypothetical protein PCANC_05072 [Puccinia coronata f. sp. avenae]
MFLIPAVPVVHLGNGRTPSPKIMLMIPSPTNQRANPATNTPRAAIIDLNHAPVVPAKPAQHPDISRNPMTMEEFLTLSWIPQADTNTRELIERRKIWHWTYFSLSNEQQLRELGFEEGPARLLCLGAARANSISA